MEIQLLSLNDLMISAAWEKSDSCAFSTPPLSPYYVSSLFLSFASLPPLASCIRATFSFFLSLYPLFPLPLFPSLSINTSMGKSEAVRYYCQHTGSTFQPRMSQTWTADFFVFIYMAVTFVILCQIWSLWFECFFFKRFTTWTFFTYMSRARPKSFPSSTAAATWGRSGQFSGCSGPAYWRRALPWLWEVYFHLPWLWYRKHLRQRVWRGGELSALIFTSISRPDLIGQQNAKQSISIHAFLTVQLRPTLTSC